MPSNTAPLQAASGKRLHGMTESDGRRGNWNTAAVSAVHHSRGEDNPLNTREARSASIFAAAPYRISPKGGTASSDEDGPGVLEDLGPWPRRFARH